MVLELGQIRDVLLVDCEPVNEVIEAAHRYAFVVVDDQGLIGIVGCGSTYQQACQNAVEELCALWVNDVGRDEATRCAKANIARYAALVETAEVVFSLDVSPLGDGLDGDRLHDSPAPAAEPVAQPGLGYEVDGVTHGGA
jgi:hypothetical protein